MIQLFFKILFSIVLVEAITEVMVKSVIFEPVRKFMFDRREIRFFRFLHDMLDCGYCFSVWVGWFIAILLFVVPPQSNYFIHRIVDWFFIGIALHRGANLFHYVMDCFKKWSEDGQGY